MSPEARATGSAADFIPPDPTLPKLFRVTRHRGEVVDSPFGPVLATVHPSSVLRAPPDARDRARKEFFEDVAQVARHLRAAAS